MVRRRGRLLQAARADRAAARFFGRAAVFTGGADAASLDDGNRCRYPHDRPVCGCRNALLGKAAVGASWRRARRAPTLAPARAPPWLAHVDANPARRRDHLARDQRPSGLAMV